MAGSAMAGARESSGWVERLPAIDKRMVLSVIPCYDGGLN
jgi:hypothetical protein